MTKKKTYPVCSWCKSPNIKADAYATWNHDAQQWEIDNAFDKGGYCDDCDGDCDGECSVSWVDGDPPEEVT